MGEAPPPPTGSARAKLKAFADALAREPHLAAVRDGVVAALPLVLIGSLFLLLAQPPSATLQALTAPYVKTIVAPQKMLTGLIAIYVCFATARSLAKHYALDELSVPLVALASFMVTHKVAPLAEAGRVGLDIERLGAGGLFGALLTALGSVHVQRLFILRNWTIRLPGGAPDSIVKSFASIIPGFASIVLVWLIVHVGGIDYVTLLSEKVRPHLLAAAGSATGALGLVLVDSALWLLGVHPLALLGVFKPVWLAMIAENQQAAAANLPLPNIATREFFLWFVWQGGSGGTLAVALLLIRARSALLRGVGKLGIVPACFNINEPLLFGLPVVMNPKLALPFVLAPLASCAVAYAAMSFGLVDRPRLDVIWTLPAPIGAWLTTGGDPRAVALQLGNLGLSMLIWWPFLRAYDREQLAREEADARTKSEAEARAKAAAPPITTCPACAEAVVPGVERCSACGERLAAA